jgi:hypothetical protein
MKESSTDTLIKAMRVLARDIQSGDGIANAAIDEAADRLQRLKKYEHLYREEQKSKRALKCIMRDVNKWCAGVKLHEQ